MDVPTLADHAGQVISGTVESLESYWTQSPKRIESRVIFKHVEYLKGKLPDSTDSFTLVVPGGTVGTTSMRIGCAPEFTEGSRWLLMLLPSYRTFPTVGLAQGAFLIEPDATGTPRVLNASRRPVAGVDFAGAIQVACSARTKPADRLVAAQGARIVKHASAADTTEAISYTDFVNELTPILAASRDHHLTAPAGRRIVVRYTPVHLSRSLGHGSPHNLTDHNTARLDANAATKPASIDKAQPVRREKRRGAAR